MSTAKNIKVMEQAYANGCERADAWLKRDAKSTRIDDVGSWRAIGYADAVLSFEDSPVLADLMREWEQGFDTTLGAESPSGIASPIIETPVGGDANPYYKNIDRAPYELGHLMQELPTDFGIAPAVELKHVHIASAAETHSHVAGNTILSGIEAIGQLMEAAGTSGEESLSSHTLFSLGGLLRHLAVEGQYLRGVGDSLAYSVALYGERDAVMCRKEVRHA